jgi:hypothetical protein
MMSRERAERLAQRARRRPPAAGGMVGCLHEPGEHARGLRDEVLDP